MGVEYPIMFSLRLQIFTLDATAEPAKRVALLMSSL